MPARARLPALVPRGQGHQFVVYGDSCSGVAGALHEKTFASVNAVVQRLEPPPEFIAFLGDEVAGYAADRGELEAQWRHWLHHEMAWLDRQTIPLWNTTSNHTTYDKMSEATFSTMLAHLPRNGPPGQEGLSYFVRRGDLLMVFVHTMWTGLGGEGHVETAWLRDVLHRHADARHKLVLGHHPVFPINGFSGDYQRQIGPEHAGGFWNVLVEAGVLAYLCSHILAFDVQVHRGVLQVCTAGAGRRIACQKAWSTCIVSRVRSTPKACATRCSTPKAGCANDCRGPCDWPTSRNGTCCRPARVRRPSQAAPSTIAFSACGSPAARRPVTARRRRCCRPSGPICRCRCGSGCAGSTSD